MTLINFWELIIINITVKLGKCEDQIWLEQEGVG
jgi:hypothetical protein